MENAVRAVACAIACSGSIVGAGLAAGQPSGYFVIVLGFIGFIVFGLFTIHQLVGSVNPSNVMEYMFGTEQPRRKKKKSDELE